MLQTKTSDQTSTGTDSEGSTSFVCGCLFCELPAEKFEVLDENELCLTLRDSYPVTDGHCLIIPKQHVETWFDMNPEANPRTVRSLVPVQRI